MSSPKNHSPQKHQPRPEGNLRQSQLVTTFGPGAMVDLVHRSVVIGGLEHWSWGKTVPKCLDDERLRRSLVGRLKQLDPELELAKEGYFRVPPEGDSREPSMGVGIRALQFPRWFVCVGCSRLARIGDSFEAKGERYEHQCTKNKRSLVVPVRFVVACKHGHLSDFPWVAFAHTDREGGSCERPELYLDEKSMGDISRIIVRCENCHTQSPMSRANHLQYRCTGERPWLGGLAVKEECKLESKLLVRTASDAYFSQVVSALRLPEPNPDPLVERLREPELWKAVQGVEAADELRLLYKLQPYVKAALDGFAVEKIVAAIERERGAKPDVAARPLRSAEFDKICSSPIEEPGTVTPPEADFAAYRIRPSPGDLPKGVRGLVIVPCLRETRVQVSFSRFDSVGANLQGEFDFAGREVKPAVLTLPSGNEKWLPAAEIRGEGIFIQLDEQAVHEWESREAVAARAEQLRRAFEAEGPGKFPGVRFYMLHSLSHLLLTAISLECGYAASAIRERIYCSEEGSEEPPDMAALLLSTGTTGSEGTLGGLVEEGRRLRHHLREAWELGRLCSNDPVCAAHDPSSESSDRRTEGAACHGCLYIAECSCERFNRHLDRALVVPTIGTPSELAFFEERP